MTSLLSFLSASNSERIDYAVLQLNVFRRSSIELRRELRNVSRMARRSSRTPEYDPHVDLNLTAVFKKVEGGFIGFVEELPGANTQGTTLEETRENLTEAITLILEVNRQLAEEEIAGAKVIREPIKITA